jgi:hypothetical protein
MLGSGFVGRFALHFAKMTMNLECRRIENPEILTPLMALLMH